MSAVEHFFPTSLKSISISFACSSYSLPMFQSGCWSFTVFLIWYPVIHFCVWHCSLPGPEADYIWRVGWIEGPGEENGCIFLGVAMAAFEDVESPSPSGFWSHPCRAGSSLTQAESKCRLLWRTHEDWWLWGMDVRWGRLGLGGGAGRGHPGYWACPFKQIHGKEAWQLHWKMSNTCCRRSQGQ